MSGIADSIRRSQGSLEAISKSLQNHFQKQAEEESRQKFQGQLKQLMEGQPGQEREPAPVNPAVAAVVPNRPSGLPRISTLPTPPRTRLDALKEMLQRNPGVLTDPLTKPLFQNELETQTELHALEPKNKYDVKQFPAVDPVDGQVKMFERRVNLVTGEDELRPVKLPGGQQLGAPPKSSAGVKHKNIGQLDEAHGGSDVSYNANTAQYEVTEKDGTVRPYNMAQDGKIHLVGEATQLATAQQRAASYAQTRMYPMLDTQNNNAPMMMSAADINKTSATLPGRYIPASTGVQALKQTSLVEDIRGNINQTRDSLKALKGDFDTALKTKIAFALRDRDPGSAMSALISSGALAELTPEQQDYVQNLTQLAENAMAMRSVLGAGQGSDELRQAIIATIPNVITPNKQYAIGQLQKFENTLNRLSRGIPMVPLRNVGNPASGKTIVRKGYNKTTNQTQLIYSDGTSEIVDGKR